MSIETELYHCILSDNGIQMENFYREAESAEELIKELRCFQYEGEWRIYVNDELIITATA